MGVEFLCITSLASTCPLSCLDVFFSSRAFQSICKEQTITLPIYGLFRDLHGTSLVITSTRSHPVLVLVTRDSQLELCLPHYLQTSLRSPLYILRDFPCIKFPHTHPQIFLNSSWISLHSLPQSHFPSYSPPDPISLQNPQFTNKIYSASLAQPAWY